MPSHDDIRWTRRHVLRLASGGSVAIGVTGLALLGAAGRGEADSTATNARPPKPRELCNLVDALIGKDPNDFSAKTMRVYFDLHATETIETFELNKGQWELFVRFEQDNGPGGKIKKAASKEHGQNGGNTVAWEKNFDDFRSCWNEICDGYVVPEGCQGHPGGTDCADPHHLCTPPGNPKIAYAYPEPHIDSVSADPKEAGAFVIKGEGILKGAQVRVYRDAGATDEVSGSPFSGSWTGTFRCSAFKFKPTGLTPGSYYLKVFNAIGSEVATDPIESTAKLFTVTA